MIPRAEDLATPPEKATLSADGFSLSSFLPPPRFLFVHYRKLAVLLVSAKNRAVAILTSASTSMMSLAVLVAPIL